MRKFLFVILISCLLLSVGFVYKRSIVSVQASPDVYQGNLVLNGNNVTLIEDTQFDINGSIVITENATLILRNAVLNVTQTVGDQFNMTLTDALDGFPRLIVENGSITSNYRFQVYVKSSSLVNVTKLSTGQRVGFNMQSTSSAFVSDSSIGELSDFWFLQHSASLTASNSSFYEVSSWDSSTVAISYCMVGHLKAQSNTMSTATNCTVNRATVSVWHANVSVTGLDPDFFGYWNFKLNNTVEGGSAPNFTFVNTEVNNWSFELRGTSNGTISDSSQLYMVTTQDTSVCYLYDTPAAYLFLYDNSSVILVNATAAASTANDQAMIFYWWYLDAHVVDSIGQDVADANVTVSYPNVTVTESLLTDAGGMVQFTLMEKMKNATGTYPMGAYVVNATYLSYTDNTTVTMSGNQEVTLTLADFVIPEFPSLLFVLPLLMMGALLTVVNHRRKRRNNQ